MGSDKQIKNWLNLAEYDFDTAEAMLKSGRYLYVVFTCQQCIEKSLKAIYVSKKGLVSPYTHNLLKQVESCELESLIDQIQRNFIAELNSFYIEGRYSEQLEELKSSIKKESAKEIFLQTKELYKWMRNQLA